MRINLTVQEGPHESRVFSFEEHDNFLVGRSDRAHFRLPHKDKSLSRIHFMVEVNPPQCRLTDMGSTNGTKVNGRKVATADLRDGDLIAVGKTVLRVSVEGGQEHAAPVPDTLPPPSAPAVSTRLAPGLQTKPIARSPGSYQTISADPAPRHPADRASESCRVCAAPLSGIRAASQGDPSPAGSPPLCPACREEVRSRPQPIAGYQVVRELGRGGMGIVSLALRLADGTLVALKTIRPAVAGTRAQVERFLREASILRALDHPNIVAFRDLGEADGLLYFAMDYVAGTDAARLQKTHGGPLPIGRAVELVCQFLRALDYAHAKGFVHRDIKPANVLVAQEGGREVVRLADFGLSRVYQASQLSGLTLTGDLAGTAAFMAPEQITHLREARPPVDQYAAGATLYKLLTDRPIYDLPRRLEQQVLMILQDTPVPIRSRRPDLPEGLAQVIHRSLAREPGDRFADVLEMRRALAPYRK
jgi:hypothetical protein